ncbi:hypothetical protein OZX74_08900 [Bifidobacterium sp. ESL0798]|uniref:hypothetical protein n=1 Tax=Bifidobacterium sp. ESL0798 TaxID=2983235 RepID=UPI0023F811E4|nr:hypothetical protein [Bifidobacterium sp. ESL0798]WEV73978.1 hypothetical protein OZX74_08900 [Bifidobacterium sp. ESL0798]
MSRTERASSGTRKLRRRPVFVVVLLALAVVAGLLYVGSEGHIMALLPHPIIREKADIPKERLERGTVQTVQPGGRGGVGGLDLSIHVLQHDLDGWHIPLTVFARPFTPGRDMDLKVGQTRSDARLGVAITLVALKGFEETQAADLLFEPYQDGPSIRQQADVPAERLREGEPHELRKGESMKVGDDYDTVSLGYCITKEEDGTYLVPIQLNGGMNESKDMSMAVGQSRTVRLYSFSYTVTLLALNDIDGRQGATLIATSAPIH